MRIALVTETYPPEINGVAITLGHLVGALASRGHTLQVCRPRQGARDLPRRAAGIEEELFAGVPIPCYPSLRLGLPARRRLERLWRAWQPDVVQVITEGPLGESALRAARRLGVPAGSDLHTRFEAYSRHYGMGWLRPLAEAYLRRLHNAARCTIVPTRELRDELHACGYRNLAVVARGVDTALFAPERRSAALRARWGASENTLVVLYVGRIAPEKNIELVLYAFEQMRRSRPDSRLVLVGDGPMRANLAHRYPYAVFCGMRCGVELAEHYASGDVFLFPSTSETYGNVTVEAMASGLAVIAYDYAAAHEHIRHAANGLLAPFDDSAAFIGLAAALANDPARVRELGRQACASARHIGWAQVADRFEEVLRTMVAGLPVTDTAAGRTLPLAAPVASR